MTEQIQHALAFPTFPELKDKIKKLSKDAGVSQDPKIYQVTAGQRVKSVHFWVYEKGNTKLNYNCAVSGSKTYRSTFVLKCSHRNCQGSYLVTVTDSSLITPYVTFIGGKVPRKKIRHRLDISHSHFQNLELYKIVKIINSHSC
jgi:hypothetical protein